MKQNLTSTFFCIILAVVCIAVPHNVEAAIAGKASSNASLNRGLIGYWTFDGKDMANGVALDKSGNGNTGNLISIATSTFYTDGKIGQGAKFDGVNDYVNLPATAFSFERTDSFSISAWIKRSSQTTLDAVVGRYDTATNYRGYSLFITQVTDPDGYGAGNAIVFDLISNYVLNNRLYCRTDNVIVLDRWQHIVATYSGGSVTSSFKIYVDGSSKALTCTPTTLNGTIQNSKNLHIGDDQDSDFFPGSMDDVRIYNHALSATEVKQLYVLGASKQAVSSKVTNTSCSSGLSCGLKAYWTFDGKDTANGVLLDTSGLSNTGNFANIATSTFYTEGKVGQGARFDGVDDFAAVHPVANDIGSGSVTVSAWFKLASSHTSSLANAYTIFSLADSSSGNDIRLCFAMTSASPICSPTTSGVSGGKLCLIGYTGAVDKAACTSQSSWTGGVWYHVVALIDTNGGGEKLYVNAALAGSDANTTRGSPQSTLACISTDVVGSDCSSNNLFSFKGSIDDVRIYNRALSATEIQQLYNAGR